MPPTKISWSDESVGDLEQIHAFISRDSSHYATIVVDRLVAAVDRLRAFPESGRVVPELNDPAVREIIHGSYRIVYELHEGGAEVLTVFRASRILPLLELDR